MDALAILGGGKIGEALLTGLLRGERTPADIVMAEKHPDRAAYLASTYGVRVVDIADAAARLLGVETGPTAAARRAAARNAPDALAGEARLSRIGDLEEHNGVPIKPWAPCCGA